MDQDGLYQRQVIERARMPVHAGTLEGATCRGEGTNPMCGDRVRVGVWLDAESRIETVRHQTRGCAICQASADMMAERVAGSDARGAVAMGRDFTALLQTGQGGDGLAELTVFAPLRQHRSRIRCATLAWSALEAALNEAPVEIPVGESNDG